MIIVSACIVGKRHNKHIHYNFADRKENHNHVNIASVYFSTKNIGVTKRN